MNFNVFQFATPASQTTCPICRIPIEYNNMALYRHLTEGKCKSTFRYCPIMNNRVQFTNASTLVTDNGSYVLLLNPNTSEKAIEVCAFSSDSKTKDRILELHFDKTMDLATTYTIKIPIITDWTKNIITSVGYIPTKALYGKSNLDLVIIMVRKQEFILDNWIMHNKLLDIGIDTTFNNDKITGHKLINNQTVNQTMAPTTFQFKV